MLAAGDAADFLEHRSRLVISTIKSHIPPHGRMWRA
jgi:hypothetical protein